MQLGNDAYIPLRRMPPRGMERLRRRGLKSGLHGKITTHRMGISLDTRPDNTMHPRFTLPPAEPGATLNLATKPKQLDAWLGRLPYAYPIEAASELADFMATCVRVRLSPDRLDQVIAHIRPTALHLLESLKESIQGESLPLSPSRQQTVDLCVRLMLEIGHACKLVILSRLGKRFQLFGAKPVASLLYVLLHALKQAAELCLETHQSPPLGLWRDMHQAYAYALNGDMTDAVSYDGGDGPNLDELYKQALLLVLADPFRIPLEELPGTKRLIQEHCGLVELMPGDNANRHGGTFAIDPDNDSPVIVLSRESQENTARWQLMVNTTGLVKQLSLMASQYARDKRVNAAQQGGTQTNLAYLEMLHRLKAQWGGSVQRLGNRHPRYESTRYEVLFGLKKIHRQCLAPDPGIAVSPFDAAAEPSECLLVNDSVGGLALSRERPVDFQLKIGEVVALRIRSSDRWSIGIVRWFRTTRVGKAIFGLQLLAPGAHAVQVRRAGDDRAFDCLWLPATPSLRQGEMVLCPGGRLEVGTSLTLLSDRTEPRNIRLEQLAELTPSIEAYRFSG